MIQRRDGRLSVLTQLLLGTAGLTVTALAVIAFEHAGEPPRASSKEERHPQAIRQQQTTMSPARRAEIEQLRARVIDDAKIPSKCVAGTLFREINDAWTNVGPC